ncbi:predicted protein [Nematostella vectensis]|uniref:Uncharacterized protein n=1 Tax=Nematostella vectensis TaxID=45351 RepID=A7STG2_NEMVE|nr:predicted protein [Nematostella vectensis]|eukprot:XP_001625117.1 predicted protein [Nematostella vectensis]
MNELSPAFQQVPGTPYFQVRNFSSSFESPASHVPDIDDHRTSAIYFFARRTPLPPSTPGMTVPSTGTGHTPLAQSTPGMTVPTSETATPTPLPKERCLKHGKAEHSFTPELEQTVPSCSHLISANHYKKDNLKRKNIKSINIKINHAEQLDLFTGEDIFA